MQDFTFGATRWRTIRAFGANPLVRVSDRIEATVVVSAVSISVLAAPVAGAVGTAVYDARSRTYAAEAQTGRTHSAIVGATRGGDPVARPYLDATIVDARWRSEGVEHTASFSVRGPVAVGDRVDIWINDKGERGRPPPPLHAAVIDAVGVAASLSLVVLGTTAALVLLVRRQLDRRRDADWEREIRDLIHRTSAD
ncbi:hypothetical protein [Mycobacterium sp. 236(2023)]|uniref:Rv1733c family protein n=1 Tax=Mycobacterium sp. 236(2023) TaxID=3038163 RepID=UPI0024155858|nr:hypothetical protein [Mycobacterium sp. 236(2023)]MDG4667236.1 hypothetical protein [Mycobacterium sp. 236(2023)]